MHDDIRGLFDLTGRVAVITGGCGLLGSKHAEAIAAAGGSPVLVDLAVANPEERAAELASRYGVPALGATADVTNPSDVRRVLSTALERLGSVDILINNAANNPKMEDGTDESWTRLENFPLDA